VTFSSRTNRAYVAVSAKVAEATLPGGVARRSRFQARRASRGLRRARDRRGRPGVTKSDLAELQVDAEIRAPLERVYPPRIYSSHVPYRPGRISWQRPLPTSTRTRFPLCRRVMRESTSI